MFSKLWGHIKNFFRGCANFFKKHFHKAVAVIGAGFVMCTLEIFGLVLADMLLLPVATVSIIGLVFLCFSYFLVIFGSLVIGSEVFEFLWKKCQFDMTPKAVTATVLKEDGAEEEVETQHISGRSALGAAVAASLAGAKP